MTALFQSEQKKIPDGTPVDVDHVTHGVLKDIEYFQQDLKKLSQNATSNQIVNYTWEKASEQSPSFYKPFEASNPKSKFETQNTLDLMATYNNKNYHHVVKQNEWQALPIGPPIFKSYPEKRRVIVLSTMSQYMENMNKVFILLSFFC